MATGPASTYASSKHALGMCDRCGFTYPLRMLKYEVFNQRLDGLRVCPDCLDVDQPQLQLGQVSVYDPQALQDPRPDLDKLPSTTYFGWAPVGNPICAFGTGAVGTVRVVIT